MFHTNWLLRQMFRSVQLGIVGQTLGADGTEPDGGRQGKTGEAIVGKAHGDCYEAASRGVLFAAADQGVGVAVGTTLSTTAMLVLYNPQNSGKRLAVVRRSLVYFSGTFGTGAAYDCILKNPGQTVPSGGTLLTSQCLDAGYISAAAAPVGAVRTAATVDTPTIIAPIAYLAPELATTVTAPQFGAEWLKGAIVIEPGCSYQVQAVAAAGTSPKVSLAVWWEEVPIVSGQG